MISRLALITASLLMLATAPAASAAPKGQQPTVKLLGDTTARAYPGDSAKAVFTVKATRPLTGSPTVLPVLDRSEADGRPWVRVLLPTRPNSSSAWIPADGTQAGSTAWRITVSRKARTATVVKNGRAVRRFRVVIGAAGTPTPAGSFFVAETVKQPRGTDSGPYALATSAYSNVLQEFAGGPGQIALHGRTGLSNPLGSAASHGCVRLADSAIVWLAARVPTGTRITIR